MSQRTHLDPSPTASIQASAVKRLVMLSGAFLVLQVASTDYGAGADESAVSVFWFIIGAVLLWLVYRKRSRVARGFVIVLSMVGAVIYAIVAIGEARGGLLAVLYIGQALPLLSSPVRQHVRRAN